MGLSQGPSRPGGDAGAHHRSRGVEEAGVRGRVEPQPFAHYRYASAKGRDDLVAAFRLSVERKGLAAEAHRDPAWLGFEAARSRLAAGRDSGVGEQMERVLLAAQGSTSVGFGVP